MAATTKQEPVGTTLTYAGPEKKEIRATYKSPKAGALFRMGYEGVPSQVSNLPFWLPNDLRNVGKVVYDDGEGFKHNKGKMAYSVTSTGTWKKFDTLIVTHRFQGMQQFDNWQLAAHYDKESGFLLHAAVSTSMGDRKHVTGEVTATSSSDPALKKKLE